MTDDERKELRALESANPVVDSDRLRYLRLRAAGVATWAEVNKAIGDHLDRVSPGWDKGPSPFLDRFLKARDG